MREICGNCGQEFRNHYVATCHWPMNYCPYSGGAEALMTGTVFKPTGKFSAPDKEESDNESTNKIHQKMY